ncbi:MAG TPA: biotin--[acetyl-CoA-carboxylase] ligase [Acidimicrobiales bacterium]|nr:biotin--[acetyl-CoA-carboxylase] ligase [Acidimicrobiales bacterium]
MSASGFEVHRLAVTDSTNDWALGAARDGAPDRTVVVADFQRRGRGRLDRRWEAPAGTALLCTVLLRPELDVGDRHLCAVAVGLAALEACTASAALGVGLKWPNDLVVGDRKLGGILAETDGQEDDDGTTAVVVGLGLNVSFPGPPDANATSLEAASGRTVTRDQLLASYLDALDARVRDLRMPHGRTSLVRAYRRSLVTLGRRVRVQLHDTHVVGVADDVDDQGHLVVVTEQETRVFATGDVVHLRDLAGGAAEVRE